MNIALVQINPTVGDLEGNTRKVLDGIARARAAGAELAVFCEMVIPGYPPKDILLQDGFVDRNLRAVERIAREVRGIAALVGCVTRNPGPGRPFFNSAALLEDGKVRHMFRKALLPSYDVFDEDRYFQDDPQPTVIPFGNTVLGGSICEDIWNDKDYWQHQRYPIDPIERQVAQGAKLLINISASPFHHGKQALRESMLAATARKYGVPVVYVNQVGGNDDIVFDGRSIAFDRNGGVIARAASFREDLVLVDPFTGAGAIDPTPPDGIPAIHQALVLGIHDYAAKCGFNKVVIGLSGGIDSALTAALAAEAFGPKNVLGVAMPSRYSSDHSVSDAEQLARNLGLDYRLIPIESGFSALLDMLAPAFAGRAADVTEENLQARLRGVILMALSNKFNALVLSTGNKSEVAVGYCTLYGDMCGGLDVLADVPKTMVYDLSKHINREREVIPAGSITKPPSAELRPNQKDQDSLPPYDVLDGILRLLIEEEKSPAQIVAAGYDLETVKRVITMVNRAEFKRQQAPPGIKITSRAFGTGRPMPIAQRYNPFAEI